MSALYLNEADVRELLDMELAIDVIEQAFQQWANDRASNVPRQRAKAPGAILHSMCATADYLGLVGWKVYTTTRGGAKFLVGVSRQSDGELLALIEANYLGQLRTGAASGVATSYMARPDSKVVGMFGSGQQARTQLKAVCTVCQIEVVEIYSRNEERRRTFAEEMSEYCNTRVIAVHSPEEAAAEKDIVICASTSRAPLFDGRVLDEGTHINAVGSNFLEKTELDLTTIQRSDIIVCDSIAQCRLEAGDFVAALDSGITDWQLMHELADVVTGRTPGRAAREQITLFKSVGLALEDLALAGKLFELAEKEGFGTRLPF
ncbi:MAG: Ornithine cyclodeaminase [Planctomycetaceae bacterium]|nr:Ornithine cyclodeaminase [Planctomycetaceae bacterium]